MKLLRYNRGRGREVFHRRRKSFSRTRFATLRLRANIQGGPKNGYPVLFLDNFGNSAPILTILLLLQAEMYGA